MLTGPAKKERDVDVEAVLCQLEAHDFMMRKNALLSLADLGPAALEYTGDMGALLEDEAPEVRKTAISSIAKIGDTNFVSRFASSLDDPDKSVRAEAATALGAVGGHAASHFAEQVAKLARDTEEDVGLAAVECLVKMAQVKRLTPFLSSSMPTVRRNAIVEIGRSPQERLNNAALIEDRLQDKDTMVRLAAVNASGELGGSITADHLASLASFRSTEKQVKIRRAAVQALGKIGTAAVPQLLSYFQDEDDTIRHFAAETIGNIGGEDAASGAAELLQESSALVRRTALLALGKLQANGRDHAAEISEHLNDPDFAARLAAIQALSDLGASSEAGAIADLCEDETKGLRQAAVSALAKMGSAGAAEALRFFDDKDYTVRAAAVRVFSPLHSKLSAEFAFPYAESVAAKINDEDWRVRIEAAKALGDLHASAYAAQVASLSSHPDVEVRRVAICALEKMGPAATPHLGPFLQDGDEGIRRDALRISESAGGDIEECD